MPAFICYTVCEQQSNNAGFDQKTTCTHVKYKSAYVGRSSQRGLVEFLCVCRAWKMKGYTLLRGQIIYSRNAKLMYGS